MTPDKVKCYMEWLDWFNINVRTEPKKKKNDKRVTYS